MTLLDLEAALTRAAPVHRRPDEREPAVPLIRKQMALLHVAKAKLGLDDPTYRAVLARLGGVTSSTELDGAGFEAVMGFFEWKGFEPPTATGPDGGRRPGMASFAQLELVRALWCEWSGAPVEGGLDAWLKGTFKVDSPRFLTAEGARRGRGQRGGEAGHRLAPSRFGP